MIILTIHYVYKSQRILKDFNIFDLITINISPCINNLLCVDIDNITAIS